MGKIINMLMERAECAIRGTEILQCYLYMNPKSGCLLNKFWTDDGRYWNGTMLIKAGLPDGAVRTNTFIEVEVDSG